MKIKNISILALVDYEDGAHKKFCISARDG